MAEGPHRIRVLQVVDTLQRAGKERVAVNLANGLASLGYASHLLSTRALGPLADELRPDVSRTSAGRRSRWDIAGLRRVVRLVDEQQIEIVHSHNASSSYLMRVALTMTRRRPLHVVHDHRGPATERAGLRFWDRRLLRNVDAWVGASQEICAHAQREIGISAERCEFVPNGIEMAPFSEPPQGPPTVVQVANLHWPKDHLTAVRAAARVHAHRPDLEWICVGRADHSDPGYAAAVAQEIERLKLSECFRVLGERDDVPDLIRRARVGVLSSEAEGLPLALLEYLGAGRPAIITEVGQGPELLRRAEAGWSVPPGDARRLAEAVEAILDQPSKAREMGARGRELVAREYSADAMCRRVSGLYQRLLEAL